MRHTTIAWAHWLLEQRDMMITGTKTELGRSRQIRDRFEGVNL